MTSLAKHGSANLELIKGRWREFRREPSAFFFVLFMPILWMAILGFAFSGARQERYGIGWLDAAMPNTSVARIQTALQTDPKIRLVPGALPDLQAALVRGDILLIVVPSTEATGSEPNFFYSFDPANRDAGRARLVVDNLIQSAAGRRDVLRVTDQPVSVPGTRYIDFLVPGLIALSVMTTSLFGVGATIVASRRENLLKRYLVTPMSPLAYIQSHIVGRMITLSAELLVILVFAWGMFGFRVQGSWLLLVTFAVLGAGAFTAIALLCGSRTSNVAVMNGMTNLISLPMMIVSGVWFSRTNFPEWIAGPARFLPLTALVDGLRRIALEGATWSGVWPEALVLVIFLVAATAGARALFKWY